MAERLRSLSKDAVQAAKGISNSNDLTSAPAGSAVINAVKKLTNKGNAGQRDSVEAASGSRWRTAMIKSHAAKLPERRAQGWILDAHPLFHGTSREVRQELSAHIQHIELPPDEESQTIISDIFEEEITVRPNRLLLKQGEDMPDKMFGLVLLCQQDEDAFEILYNGVPLVDAEGEAGQMIQGVAGQEVAFGISTKCIFSVRVKSEPKQDVCFIDSDGLSFVLQRHRKDRQLLESRIRTSSANFIKAWTERYMSRVPIKLFANISNDFKVAVVQRMSVQIYKAGSLICKEHGPAESCIYVHSGNAEVVKEGVPVHGGTLKNGLRQKAWQPWWGMLELTGASPENVANVRATTDCIVWELTTSDAAYLEEKYPKEFVFIHRVAYRQLQMIAPLVGMVQAISLFSDCGKGFLEVLGKHLTQRTWPTGEVIVREGTEGDDMFVIMLGKCRVTRGKEQDVVGHLRSGNAFGLHALLNITKTRTANVQTDTVCDTRSLHRAGLLSALSLYPEEEQHVLELIDAHGQNHKAATLALLQASEKEGGFSKAFTKVLADNMFDRPFLTKQVIIEQGDVGKVFVVLVHGIVDVEVDGVKVAQLAAPAIFGEQALLVPGSTSTATVRAATVAECMTLPTDTDATAEFSQVFAGDFEKLHAILQKKLSRNKQTIASLIDSTIADSQVDTSFFRDCSPEFMAEISHHLQKTVYMEGQTLFVEGEDTYHGIIIHQGWASVDVKGEQVGRLGPGEVVGEFVILGQALKATATVRAEERMVAFTIERTSFRELLAEYPEEEERLQNVMKQRAQSKTRRNSVTERQLIVNSRAVNKFLSVRDNFAKDQEEEEPKPKKPPLLGYVKARKWLRQRKAAVAEAPSIRWQRMVARGDIAEPLPPDRGLRVTKNGAGTPWRPLPLQDAVVSAMRARKVDDVYGRKVWQESFNAISNRVALSPVVAQQGEEEVGAAGGMPPGVIEDTAQELEAALNSVPETTALTAVAEDYPTTLLPTAVWKTAPDQGQSAQSEPRPTGLAPHLPEQALQHGRQSLHVSVVEDPFFERQTSEEKMSPEEKRSRKSLSESIKRISIQQIIRSQQQEEEKERAAEAALARRSRQSMIQLAELLVEPETTETLSEHGSESESPTRPQTGCPRELPSPRQEASSPRHEPPTEALQEQSDALQETSEPGGRSSRGLQSVDLEQDDLWQPECLQLRVEALVHNVVSDALLASPEDGGACD